MIKYCYHLNKKL